MSLADLIEIATTGGFAAVAIFMAVMFWRERDAHRKTQDGRIEEVRAYAAARLEDAQKFADQMERTQETTERIIQLLQEAR